MKIEKEYYLSWIPFFSQLSPEEVAEIAGDFRWEAYPKGVTIIEQGQRPKSFYLLCEGKVEVTKGNGELATSETKEAGPDSVFGEISLLTGKPFPYSVRCLENSHVLSITADDFAQVLLRKPQIYQSIIRELTDDLIEANQMLSDNKYKEVLRSTIKLTQYQDKFYGIWGSVRTTKEVERKLEEVKKQPKNLLIRGERGTGRQMMAWYMHQHLYQEAAPFVVVDGRRFDQQWGNMVDQLLDIAAGGTLFIQEIDDILPQTQLILAQAIKMHSTNCFIIGSLQIQQGISKDKLLPELEACFIHRYTITPLRERKRDIPVLAQGILEKLAQKNHRKTPTLTPEASQILLSHHYRQGNVTELIQVLERSFFLATDNMIGLEQIFFGPTSEQVGHKINLLRWPFIDRILKKSNALLWIRRIAALLFFLVIGGMIFSPHLSIFMKIFALVWGLWWPALSLISPFLGRIWCTICPFSTVMDFVQDKIHFHRSVPEVLVKYDYLIVSALFLLIFWIEIITGMRSNPLYTALLLIIIQIAAVIIGVLYPHHAWCRHICPLGGFIGTASIGSLIEVRSDPAVCLNKCTTFDCYVGKGDIKGCPMSQHLPYLDNNLDCKLCFNCVRNCPHESVQVNLRFPAREVWHLKRVNQGYTIFIGMLFAILFPIRYFEPLQKIWPATQWKIAFTLAYILAAFVGGLLGWWLGKPFKTKAASKRIKLVFALTPFVLAGHIIYQMNFIPGIQDLTLGLSRQTLTGIQAASVSVTTALKVMVAITGVVLTTLTVIIVLVKQQKQTEQK
ncbi:cyclic nucleotide-binding domain-containing protein [Desulfitobacterium sp.]|uniref:cyclic nucleotide-binding domain-containing protein n=1 Tax=Desulfitobacterium sp. TaxID=49981 RepID=UPI002B1F7E35|nr:cyclic nucleotide-binding domain-containing protein [Desulfitobacterium sp.]MEA4901985.1 cyclic nucleotide-binding domain-containing protein [Desulfitobacterium sp.]